MEAKLNSYKVLQDVSIHLKPEHVEHLLDKIKEIEPENFI